RRHLPTWGITPKTIQMRSRSNGGVRKHGRDQRANLETIGPLAHPGLRCASGPSTQRCVTSFDDDGPARHATACGLHADRGRRQVGVTPERPTPVSRTDGCRCDESSWAGGADRATVVDLYTRRVISGHSSDVVVYSAELRPRTFGPANADRI